MYKISVLFPDLKSIDYHSTIVPVIGDTLNIDTVPYEVVKRVLYNDNPNYVVVHVEPIN